MREGGENKKERDITPANANVSQIFTTRGLAFTLSELLEVYIVLCDLQVCIYQKLLAYSVHN